MENGEEEPYPTAQDEAYAPGGEEDAEMEDVEEPLNMVRCRRSSSEFRMTKLRKSLVHSRTPTLSL